MREVKVGSGEDAVNVRPLKLQERGWCGLVSMTNISLANVSYGLSQTAGFPALRHQTKNYKYNHLSTF